MKYFLIIFFVVGSLSPLKGDNGCDCIKVEKHPAPQGIRYTATCWQNGAEGKILESTTVADETKATATTHAIMQAYNIREGDCLTYPNGKMVSTKLNDAK